MTLNDQVENLGDNGISKKMRLVTAALPYINNVPHLGHIVGSHLPADIFARYSRLKGYETLFIGGSDEYGTPSEIAAQNLGIDFEKFCSALHLKHKEIYDWFQISYDSYTRTSSPIHRDVTIDMFNHILKNGYISRETIEMYYSEEDKMFLPDRYIVGECPVCGYLEANGDQCEKCGKVINIDELKNPRSKLTGSIPVKKKTEHLFINLDKLSKSLSKWINNNHQWSVQVSSLAKTWIKNGLRKRGITRDLKHGIHVPLEGMENKVFYVWFEAPIAYISGVKEIRPNDWEKFWTDENSQVYHFLGKDNIPFHTIFWPAVLIADGRYKLPYQVVGMQYLNYEGQKFSKSKGIGVFCENLPKSGIDVDLLRGYLTLIIPETTDSDFKWDDFQQRVNSELIGNFGNFVNRTLSIIQNKLGSEIVAPKEADLSLLDKNFLKNVKDHFENFEKLMESAKIRQAFHEIMVIADLGNKYFSEYEIWNLVKTDEKKAREVLFLCCHAIKILAVLSCSFFPNVSQQIWEQLGLTGVVSDLLNWENILLYSFNQKHTIGIPQPVFEKLTDARIKELKEIILKTVDLKDIINE